MNYDRRSLFVVGVMINAKANGYFFVVTTSVPMVYGHFSGKTKCFV